MPETTINVIKIFAAGIFSFFLAFFMTPALTDFLYKHKLWKKKTKEKAIDGGNVEYFRKFHAKEEIKTPRLGGLLIWTSVIFLTFFLFIVSFLFKDNFWADKLNFLSRNQTWLPLFTLFSASIVGLIDDLLQVLEKSKEGSRTIIKKINNYIGQGLNLRYRLLLVFLIGSVGAWWFYFRLGYDSIYIPFVGDVFIGAFYIPLFIVAMIAIYSGGVIDGIDGLSAGTLASIFSAYGAISLFQGQIDLAAFCFAIVGSTLAFMWFNIPPARFYMGETGIIGLTATLTVVAFLTNGIVVLPIIGILLILTSASVIIQLLSKKLFNKKVFLAAPLHHHFEAKGWPHYKVTMRFWVIGVVAAIFGMAVHFLG